MSVRARISMSKSRLAVERRRIHTLDCRRDQVVEPRIANPRPTTASPKTPTVAISLPKLRRTTVGGLEGTIGGSSAVMPAERRTLPRRDRNCRERTHHFSARHFYGEPKSYLPRVDIAACACARSVLTIPEFPASAFAAAYWSSSTSARCGSPSRNAVMAAVIK